MESRNQIEYVKVSNITPHPDNPRQDLGDLTELADSIRAKGVMENLVVIRNEDYLHRMGMVNAGGEPYGVDTWADADDPHYRVVIGHRRLAAAKLAGLDVVPCVIQKMTRDEAIAAMLTENGQRAGLTPYEEGLGFQQLSLDMGKSVADIRAMTGFGETTIRSRLKIAKLDGGKVRDGLERGATLADFVELDKIQDVALKGKVLEKAGTPDFRNAMKSALEDERRKSLMKRWMEEADAFAERIKTVDHAAMKYVYAYSVYIGREISRKTSVERPEDAGRRKYYYFADAAYLYIYREITDADRATADAQVTAEKEAKSLAEAARKAREAELGEITKRHFTLRKEFVAECPLTSASLPDVMLYAASALTAIDARTSPHPECDLQLMSELLGMDSEIDFENASRENVRKELLRAESYGKPCSPARLLLCAAYSMNDSGRNGYYAREWNPQSDAWETPHMENRELDRLYQLLTELGYEMSEEENQMRDGTHSVFAGKDGSA